MKVRTKPVEVEAVQWTGMNLAEVSALSPMRVVALANNTVIISTLEGSMTAHIGDWIIKGVKGEVSPCAPDIFAMTYEVVA